MKYWWTVFLLLIPASVWPVAMANRHYQTISVPCDGLNIEGRNNGQVVLDYYQTTQIHAVSIILDEMGSSQEFPNQRGRADLSQDFSDPSGQFRLVSLFDPDRYIWIQYSPNTIQIPAGQALAPEFTCSGGGFRKWTYEIWFTGG